MLNMVSKARITQPVVCFVFVFARFPQILHQEARQRIRELSKHVREVFVAARYAERELKMEAFAERRGEKGRREAAFALDRLFEAVERAIACSKRAADGSSAFEDPRE